MGTWGFPLVGFLCLCDKLLLLGGKGFVKNTCVEEDVPRLRY
jgi:hypothetical protein